MEEAAREIRYVDKIKEALRKIHTFQTLESIITALRGLNKVLGIDNGSGTHSRNLAASLMTTGAVRGNPILPVPDTQGNWTQPVPDTQRNWTQPVPDTQRNRIQPVADTEWNKILSVKDTQRNCMHQVSDTQRNPAWIVPDTQGNHIPPDPKTQKNCPIQNSMAMNAQEEAPSTIEQDIVTSDVSAEPSLNPWAVTDTQMNWLLSNCYAMNAQVEAASAFTQDPVTRVFPTESSLTTKEIRESHRKRKRPVSESQRNQRLRHSFAMNAEEKAPAAITQDTVPGGVSSECSSIMWAVREKIQKRQVSESQRNCPLLHNLAINAPEGAPPTIAVDLVTRRVFAESSMTTEAVPETQKNLPLRGRFMINAPEEAPPHIVDTPGDYKCSICLDTTERNEVKYLPCCHAFHDVCIDAWLMESGKCPLCREGTTYSRYVRPHSSDQQPTVEYIITLE